MIKFKSVSLLPTELNTPLIGKIRRIRPIEQAFKIVSPLSQLRLDTDIKAYKTEVNKEKFDVQEEQIKLAQQFLKNPFNWYPSEIIGKNPTSIDIVSDQFKQKLQHLRFVNDKFYKNVWVIFKLLKTNIRLTEKPTHKKAQNIVILK
ncbi:hypothetical protein SS50377_20129 [Spironucleus salmonicida]|uniref:Uncharacterized protein n=1 Tax=Spironucleus salmonicida TaxID=348837 RepID=A0A9P8LYK7_9EUKA|nr:hypothetical protein SS50377_20129 [Spironucleus salmonicida]